MSIAYDVLPRPDWADVVVVTLPPGASTDSAEWARRIFSVGSAPSMVRLLLGVRQRLVGLIGVKPASAQIFDVARVANGEALITMTDRHLDFAVGVKVNPERWLLELTTAVRLHGWRGRLYFAPVRFLHDPVTRAMMRRAVGRTAS